MSIRIQFWLRLFQAHSLSGTMSAADFELAFAGVPLLAAVAEFADIVPAADIAHQFASQHQRHHHRFTNKFHRMCFVRCQRSIGLVKGKLEKRVGKFDKLAKAWNNAKGLRHGDSVLDVRAMASSNPSHRHVFRSRGRRRPADPPIHVHANQRDLEQTIKMAFGQVGQVVDARSAYRAGDPQPLFVDPSLFQ